MIHPCSHESRKWLRRAMGPVGLTPYDDGASSWEEYARCLRSDPELFFAPRARAQRRAKAVCQKCPVRSECRSFDLEAQIEFGVWGGMNWDERRSLLGAPSLGVY